MPAAMRGGSSARPTGQGAAQSAARGRGAAPAGGPSAAAILLAALAVILAALVLILATGGRGARMAQAVRTDIAQRLAASGFRLDNVRVKGASPLATGDILKAAGLYKGQPLADMDLDVIRQRIESVGWVHDVRVVRLLPDTLLIQVVERRQLAVWQSAGQRQVIDVRGAAIPEADPAQFAGLPLVVGAGADKAAAAILLELSRRPSVLSQVEALVRVDQRRWDLRLRSGGLIQLPALDEAAALRRLDELDRTSGLMRIGFERLDLRDPAVMAVRPRTGGAVAASPELPPEAASKG
ncbi:MAG: FtsQ-type POTRA domain-containing protein [Phenylobacterium sp.]|uniref:cell division protein FtsQ/DivIB n=1 Tax=Phenylobacterium sp. TaxID=1871053 RepID=UPI003018271C